MLRPYQKINRRKTRVINVGSVKGKIGKKGQVVDSLVINKNFNK